MRHHVRATLIPPLLAIAACSSTSQVLLQNGMAGFTGGDPIAVRPDSEQLTYLWTDEVIAVDGDEGMLDRLLIEDLPGLVDVAFRSDEEMLVLHRGGISLYFAGKLFRAYDLDVSASSLLAAGEESVWVARNERDGATLLRLDEERRELLPVAALEDGVSALAIAPGGCYFAVGDAVYRLLLDGEGSGEILFLFAVLDAQIGSIASDPDRGLILAATPTETWIYHQGRTRIFEPLGGRLAYADGTLFISSADRGLLLRVSRVGARLAELESGDP